MAENGTVTVFRLHFFFSALYPGCAQFTLNPVEVTWKGSISQWSSSMGSSKLSHRSFLTRAYCSLALSGAEKCGTLLTVTQWVRRGCSYRIRIIFFSPNVSAPVGFHVPFFTACRSFRKDLYSLIVFPHRCTSKTVVHLSMHCVSSLLQLSQ